MPYDSTSQLPDAVKKAYSADCQKVFMRVLNTAIYSKKSESDAFAMAHAAARNCQA